ncbi:MAG: aspartate aminotransferase family protein [Desulfobacterales bacterium]|nr:aspartate aminotransferase family protein [Desulfobacterales bacterium]
MSSVLRCSGYNLVKTDMVRGEGCYLFDSAGRRYLDLEAGVWCMALGHSHPRINRAIYAQGQRVSHIGFRYTAQVVETAAEALIDSLKIPGGKSLFLSSGSEAVEFSVQAARRITSRPLLLTLSNTHLAAYGSAGQKDGEEWFCFDWHACAGCTRADCHPGCILLAPIPFDRVGAFVFEPGSSSGLVRFPPRMLIETFARTVRGQGGLVVVDEVTTGLGRTGAWYGFEHYGLEPDLVALGKGLGNGYPVSAVAMTGGVAQSLTGEGFRYAQSHQNDPLGCAVAKEVIAAIQEEGLVERSRRVGARFLRGLEAVGEGCGLVRDVRGRGLMLAVELAPGLACEVYRALLDRGFLAGYKPETNLLRFYPPLTLEENDVDRFVENLAQVMGIIETEKRDR